MLAMDKAGDIFYRTGSVEGIHGDKVGKNGRFKLTHILLHSQRLVLEDPNGLSSLEKGIGRLVIQGDMLDIQFKTMSFLDKCYCILEDGKGLQS